MRSELIDWHPRNRPHTSTGLTTAEANARRTSGGSYAIDDENQPQVRLAASKLWAPVSWLLEAAIVFQLVLHEYPEAAVVGRTRSTPDEVTFRLDPGSR